MSKIALALLYITLLTVAETCEGQLATKQLQFRGHYFYANGYWGSSLLLNSNATYTLQSFSDGVDPTDPNQDRLKSHGIYSFKDSSIVLTPTDSTRRKRMLKVPL